ncbi:MAG: SPFH domain-containing protein, partial [Eubacteriales bacterium]|nr:SPFH domain-containing protein [Eubacteriales bacterium]
MGLIQLAGGVLGSAGGAIGGALGDQWLETIEPATDINKEVIATFGVKMRQNDRRNVNTKGTADVISNGSIIHVPENTFMLLVDGGKIISATDEAGYYQVDNTRAPSIFFRSDQDKTVAGYGNTNRNAIQRPGGIKNTILDTWERFKFGGGTPLKQTVIYINQQEIPDFRFGTKQPILFADRATLNGTLLTAKVTSFGTYSLKISDPILFYREVCSKSGKDTLTVEDMAEQYTNEYLMALQTALASLAKEGMSVVEIQISTSRIGQEMADVLDEEWQAKRGFYIYSVGIASIGLDDKTNEVLESMNADSILMDPNRRAARMTRGVSAGIEAAGSNEGGAMMGFAGIGMGMNATGMGAGMGQVMNPQQGYPQGGYPQ